MAGIRPIDYETGSIQMLSALGDIQEKRNLLEYQRMQEEIKQKRELMDMIDPITLSKNLESEVVNSRMGELRNGIASFIKNNPNHSSDELRYEIQKNLSELAQWNAKVKTIKSNIDEAIKAMPQDKTVNKSAWRSAAISKALYNPNTRSLKNIDELDDQYDYLSDVWNNKGDVLINMDEVGSELKKRIKDQPLVKMDVTVTKPVGKVKKTTQERIEIPSFATWDDTKNKIVIRTDDKGNLAQDIYDDFIGQPGSANDKLVDRKTRELVIAGKAGVKAVDVLNPDGSIKDQDSFNIAKKKWLSDYIYNNSPITRIEKDITQPTKVTVVTPGQEAAKSGLDWMKEMDVAMQGKDTNKIKTLLQSFYGGSAKTVNTTDIVGNKAFIQYQGPKDNREFIYVNGKMQLNPDYGKSSSESIEIDITDPNAIQKMGGAYQKIMGADKLVEGYVVGKSKKLP